MLFGKEVCELNVMGEFTFPEFRRRISSSDAWNSKERSVCEAGALGEVNQVIEKLGGVKSVEQSFCNQEVSHQNNSDQQPRGRLGLFSSFQKPVLNPRCSSISESVASKELSADTNFSNQFGKSAPPK